MLRFTRRLPLLAPVVGLVAAVALAGGCRSGAPRRASSAPPTSVSRYDPAHDLGPLFQDVQLSGIFADSKTFVDARPLSPPADIAARYAAARGSARFGLRAFVEQHFELPRPIGADYRPDASQTMEEHIRALWPV